MKKIRFQYCLKKTNDMDDELKLMTIYTQVSAEFVTGYIGGANGWVGITDRGFRRAPLLGEVKIIGNETTFIGTYGVDGTFSTSRRCTAATERV